MRIGYDRASVKARRSTHLRAKGNGYLWINNRNTLKAAMFLIAEDQEFVSTVYNYDYLELNLNI